MPFAPNIPRSRIAVLGIALSLLVGGCDGKSAGNGASVQIKDLETVDGTINDSMTDLDGVQSEGTMLADTGSNMAAASAARSASGAAQNATAPSSSSPDDTEVVADQ